MKGIITFYDTKKGFGFLMDINEEKRFFHISNVYHKQKFLDNIENYYYTDWVDRICYVVEFYPSQNKKGLSAQNIKLTTEIFNDKIASKNFKAKIVDVKYDTASLTRIVSGIKKGESAPFGATAGCNGTYRIGYPEVLRELNIYFRRIDTIGWSTIDVRDTVLSINGREKITSKLIETVKNNIINKEIDILIRSNKYCLADSSILII